MTQKVFGIASAAASVTADGDSGLAARQQQEGCRGGLAVRRGLKGDSGQGLANLARFALDPVRQDHWGHTGGAGGLSGGFERLLG